jgi:hypothetical protein
MAIAANSSIVLGGSKPKKDATIATGAPTVGDGDVAIWAGALVNTADRTQQIVGDWHKLFRYVKTNISTWTGQVFLEIPVGGGDPDIGEVALVTDGHVALIIGADIIDGAQSHFLDRTFKRLIERWLEESKS